MTINNCLEIKDLEERLACLLEKYNELTDQISKERDIITSDECENIHEIQIQRELIQKQLKNLKRTIQTREKMKSNTEISEKIEVGSCVKLKNHTHTLEICLVAENEASPSDGLISTASPIGKAILGKVRGEKIKVSLPSGNVPYTIEEILPFNQKIQS